MVVASWDSLLMQLLAAEHGPTEASSIPSKASTPEFPATIWRLLSYEQRAGMVRGKISEQPKLSGGHGHNHAPLSVRQGSPGCEKACGAASGKSITLQHEGSALVDSDPDSGH